MLHKSCGGINVMLFAYNSSGTGPMAALLTGMWPFWLAHTLYAPYRIAGSDHAVARTFNRLPESRPAAIVPRNPRVSRLTEGPQFPIHGNNWNSLRTSGQYKAENSFLRMDIALMEKNISISPLPWANPAISVAVDRKG